MLKKTVLLSLILWSICFLFSPADSQVLPNYEQLQQLFDDNRIDSRQTIYIRNSTAVQIKTPAISESCHLTPLTVKLYLRANHNIRASGVKVKILSRSGRLQNLITDSNGRIIFRRVKHKDFPIAVNIPLSGNNQTIRNPILSVDEKGALRLLESCECAQGAYEFALKRLMELRGKNIVKVNVTEPRQETRNKLTPLILDLSFSASPIRCLEIVLNQDEGDNVQSLKTDSNGRAIFDRLTLDDFPLDINIPGIEYSQTIQHPQVTEELARRIMVMFYQAQEYKEEAKKDKADNKFQKAGELYSEIIALNPNHAPSFNNRGVAWYHRGNVHKAINDYTKAIEKDPYYASAYYNLGGTYFSLNKYKEALNNFDTAIRCNPQKGHYYYARAVVYQKMKRIDHAVSDLDKSVELLPSFLPAYFSRGGVYYEKGEYKRAIFDWDRVIELNPNHARAYFYRGNAYCLIGENEKGLEDLKKGCNLGYQDACNRYKELFQHR